VLVQIDRVEGTHTTGYPPARVASDRVPHESLGPAAEQIDRYVARTNDVARPCSRIGRVPNEMLRVPGERRDLGIRSDR
jgi:hypothetical protein